MTQLKLNDRLYLYEFGVEAVVKDETTFLIAVLPEEPVTFTGPQLRPIIWLEKWRQFKGSHNCNQGRCNHFKKI